MKGRVPRRQNDFMIVFVVVVFSLYLVPLPRFDDHQRSSSLLLMIVVTMTVETESKKGRAAAFEYNASA